MSRHEPRVIRVRMESREWLTFADVLSRSTEAIAQLGVNGIRRKVNGSAFAELNQDVDIWCGLLGIALRHARGAENAICGEIDARVSAGMFRKPERN